MSSFACVTLFAHDLMGRVPDQSPYECHFDLPVTPRGKR